MPKSHNFYGISSETQAKIYDRKNVNYSMSLDPSTTAGKDLQGKNKTDRPESKIRMWRRMMRTASREKNTRTSPNIGNYWGATMRVVR